MKRLLETKTYKMTFHYIFRHFVSSHFGFLREFKSRLGCLRIARVTSSEKLDITSKNNLRRITLTMRPIWWIYSLTLIISYSDTVQYKIKNLTYVCGFLFTVQRIFVKYFIKAIEQFFRAYVASFKHMGG